MAIVDGEEVIFDSGKRVSVDFGIVGIGHGLRLFALPHGFMEPDEFSASELVELSQVMIERWSALKLQTEGHDLID